MPILRVAEDTAGESHNHRPTLDASEAHHSRTGWFPGIDGRP